LTLSFASCYIAAVQGGALRVKLLSVQRYLRRWIDAFVKGSRFRADLMKLLIRALSNL